MASRSGGVERRRGCRVPTTPERGRAPAAAGDEHRWEQRLPIGVQPGCPCHRRGLDGQPLTRAGKLAAAKATTRGGGSGDDALRGRFRQAACTRLCRRLPKGCPSLAVWLDAPAPLRQLETPRSGAFYGVVVWWSSWLGEVGPICTRRRRGPLGSPSGERRTNRFPARGK
jgi:hypothetical protein